MYNWCVHNCVCVCVCVGGWVWVYVHVCVGVGVHVFQQYVCTYVRTVQYIHLCAHELQHPVLQSPSFHISISPLSISTYTHAILYCNYCSHAFTLSVLS